MFKNPTVLLALDSLKNSNVILYRTFYSARRLSSDIARFFDLPQRFVVAGFTDNDTDSVDLFQMAKELVNETRDKAVMFPFHVYLLGE